jgi:hypothetical protein
VWLLLENFPIDALRDRKLPLLMQRHSLLKFGLQCHRSWILCLRLDINCHGHCFSLTEASGADLSRAINWLTNMPFLINLMRTLPWKDR